MERSDMSEKDFYQVSLKAILRDQDGKILAMKCVPTSSMAGFYEFPGGRIDQGEFSTSLEEILSRELREELGEKAKFKINPAPVALGRHLIPARNSGKWNKDLHVLLVFFEVEYFGGEIAISDEHESFAWLNLPSIKPSEYFVSGNLQGIEMYLKG